MKEEIGLKRNKQWLFGSLGWLGSLRVVGNVTARYNYNSIYLPTFNYFGSFEYLEYSKKIDEVLEPKRLDRHSPTPWERKKTSTTRYRYSSTARSATRRCLSYSEAHFEVFRPAGATCCTDGGEIWHGGRIKFHPHRCNNKGIGPPKLKFFTAIWSKCGI